MSIADQVIAVIADKAGKDKSLLTPDAKLADLEITSLDTVEIVFGLEEEFNITLPFNANTNDMPFTTVGEVIAAVEKTLKTA